MKLENIKLLERATGIIEGLAYSINNDAIEECLFNVVQMIDSVIKAESEDKND